MGFDNLKFLSNNVKGLQSTKKRLKVFEYLKCKVTPYGIIFLQETHSTINDENKWTNEFGGKVFFSHGSSNSCGVLIGFVGSNNLDIKNILRDSEGRILILDIVLENEELLLINFYNANTECNQIKTLNTLSSMIKNICPDNDKKIIFAGDLNFFFNTKLETKGGNPTFKRKSVGLFIEIKETYNLCDIWRIRNPKSKTFTFRQNHTSGFIQRRLDYILISNSLQEHVKKADILASLSSDHSPTFLYFSKCEHTAKGKGFWKFNKTLLSNETFVSQLKKLIQEVICSSSQDNISNAQQKWEFLKYKIRDFSINFSKILANNTRKRKAELENILKMLEKKLDKDENLQIYNDYKTELENIYEHIAEGIRIRSKCQWYEEGEKSTKFFLNLEKHRGTQGQIRKILVNGLEITDSGKIQSELKLFYEKLFQNNSVNLSEQDMFLRNISLPTLDPQQQYLCETDISEKELYNALKTMQNNKSPGNDGLTKEFYEAFWEDIKLPFQNSVRESMQLKMLSVSQRQAIIKLVEKKDRDKREIKNWRPISLLNVDYKIISKVLANRLKDILPKLISFEQTAYVKNRFIGESGRLISDILEVADILNIEGYLVTMDIEKAFDSLDHNFLILVLKKFGFGNNFINWIETILTRQESCIINGGITTSYFQLKRGARQGDPISAYLFILALEVLFLLIKTNKKIEGLEIFNHCFLYSAYADDTTFFLKNIVAIEELVNTFQMFSSVSGLKPNMTKCEFAGIGVLKGVIKAVCGMKCIDLTNETIKILGIHFSYNSKKMNEENFSKSVSKIQNVLGLWRNRSLTLEGRVVVFKALAISKIVYLALITNVPEFIIEELCLIQKKFVWLNSKPKIKHETLRADFKNGGLKNVDIRLKFISLKCSWIKRLFDDSFHEWKVIPLHLFENTFGKNFKFHTNLDFKSTIIMNFPLFYKSLLLHWKNSFPNFHVVASCILNEFLWYNKYIKIGGNTINFKYFSEKGINYFIHLLNNDGYFKTWTVIKAEHNLSENLYFQWMQLIHAIPLEWKQNVKNNISDSANLLTLNHHIIFNSRILSAEKLSSKEIYLILIHNLKRKPTSQSYFENTFPNDTLDWKSIYLLPRKVTICTKSRIFQYKILNNILFLNKKLCMFGKTNSPLCSFCKLNEETFLHLYTECALIKSLWSNLKRFFGNDVFLPDLVPQAAFFGFLPELDVDNFLLLNHILLIFKIYVYNSRQSASVNFEALLKKIIKIKNIEKK